MKTLSLATKINILSSLPVASVSKEIDLQNHNLPESLALYIVENLDLARKLSVLSEVGLFDNVVLVPYNDIAETDFEAIEGGTMVFLEVPVKGFEISYALGLGYEYKEGEKFIEGLATYIPREMQILQVPKGYMEQAQHLDVLKYSVFSEAVKTPTTNIKTAIDNNEKAIVIESNDFLEIMKIDGFVFDNTGLKEVSAQSEYF